MNNQTIRHIGQAGLVAIVRGQFTVNQLLQIGETLLAAHIPVLEITLNTNDALTAIERLRQELGVAALIGAGTVRTVTQFHDAHNAGAQFTVAPAFDLATVTAAQAANCLHLPGVFTATEAEIAFRAGCPLLKLFPSDSLGPRYLKALRAPLDDVQFVPTGGISAANIADYRRAGAFACGIGSTLITGPGQSSTELSWRAHALHQAWEEAS